MEGFIVGMNYEDFVKDAKTNLAVVWCVEVIGEAAKNIPMFVRKKYTYGV